MKSTFVESLTAMRTDTPREIARLGYGGKVKVFVYSEEDPNRPLVDVFEARITCISPNRPIVNGNDMDFVEPELYVMGKAEEGKRRDFDLHDKHLTGEYGKLCYRYRDKETGERVGPYVFVYPAS